MYFADTSPSSNLEIYKDLIDLYLEGNTDDEAINTLFKNVIITTHRLITGQILESSIDNKIYNLVIALSDFRNEYTRKYFSEINPDAIGIQQFQTLQMILSSITQTTSSAH